MQSGPRRCCLALLSPGLKDEVNQWREIYREKEMGVCVGGCGLVCVGGEGVGGGQASIQSIQTINVVKWLTNKRKLPTRVTLYSHYVKLLLKMFNVRFLVCLFCWNVVFLAGTFLGVSLTCTDGQLTDELSIVSTSQHQLPFG